MNEKPGMHEVKQEEEIVRAAGGLVWRQAPGGWQIALIHRPKYDDWSLPKGKLKAGEGWQAAAKREVVEETGCPVTVLGFAGSLGYPVEGKPKVVLFWHMRIEGECEFRANREIDGLEWLPAQQALERLQYPFEKAFLRQHLQGPEAPEAAKAG
jgi:8-oxo-dGTP diphosphatase